MKRTLFRLNLDEIGGDDWTLVVDDKTLKITTDDVRRLVTGVMSINPVHELTDLDIGVIKIVGVDRAQLALLKDYLSMFKPVLDKRRSA